MESTERKKCTVKVGLFVQKACGKPAKNRCSQTKKPICEDCTIYYEGKAIAKDVYAQMMKKQGREVEHYHYHNNQTYDIHAAYFWYYMQREQFYHDHQYQAFDATDEAGFSEEGFNDWEDDSNLGEGFQDS